MKLATLLLFLAVATALFAIAQTRNQSQQGQAGRYQLLSAQHTWITADKDNKAVFTEEMDMFRIDTVTGETDVLMATGAGGPSNTRWTPVGNPLPR